MLYANLLLFTGECNDAIRKVREEVNFRYQICISVEQSDIIEMLIENIANSAFVYNCEVLIIQLCHFCLDTFKSCDRTFPARLECQVSYGHICVYTFKSHGRPFPAGRGCQVSSGHVHSCTTPYQKRIRCFMYLTITTRYNIACVLH